MEYNPNQSPMNRAPEGKRTAHHRVAARLKSVVRKIDIKPRKK